MVVGCMAIHLCKRFYRECLGPKLTVVYSVGGDRFTDRQEQDQLIQVLIRMSSMHGWPTRALQRQLQDMDSLTEGEND